MITLYRADRAPCNCQVRAIDPICACCGSPAVFSAHAGAQSRASGKTALSHILAEDYGFVQLDADWFLVKRKSAEGRVVDFNEIHEEMLYLAEGLVLLGRDVVIAHVILPEYVRRYQAFFSQRGIALRVVILMPDIATILRRNDTRACWWTARDIIDRFQEALLLAPPEMRALFYDKSQETPEQTARTLADMVTALP